MFGGRLMLETVAVPAAIVMMALVSVLDVSEKMLLHGQSFAETIFNVLWLILGSFAAQLMPKRTVIAARFSFWASLVLLLVAIAVTIIALVQAPNDLLTISVSVIVALVVGWSLFKFCSSGNNHIGAMEDPLDDNIDSNMQLSKEAQERELRARKKFWLLLFAFSLFMFLCQLMLLLLFRNDEEEREGTKVNWFLFARILALGVVVATSGIVAFSTPRTITEPEAELTIGESATPYVQA